MSLQLRGGSELIDARKLLERAGIRQGYVVADLGCGTAGHFVFPAAHLVGSSGKVYAVDIQKSVLGAIESRERMEGVENIETVWADIERPSGMKIENGSVDLTLVINNLYQAKDIAALLSEAVRITKAGGTVVVVDWKVTGAPLGPSPARRVAKKDVLPLAATTGLVLHEEFEAGPYHYGLIFKKP